MNHSLIATNLHLKVWMHTKIIVVYNYESMIQDLWCKFGCYPTMIQDLNFSLFSIMVLIHITINFSGIAPNLQMCIPCHDLYISIILESLDLSRVFWWFYRLKYKLSLTLSPLFLSVMQPVTTSHVPIYLCLDSSVGFCASPPNCTITISLSYSVDLGLVGRMLGLDPSTMRLNGYYVSRIGPRYVSPGLSWGPLLDFFAQRRLPCGSEIQDAIVVQGKYVGPTGNYYVGIYFTLCNLFSQIWCLSGAGMDARHDQLQCILPKCQSLTA